MNFKGKDWGETYDWKKTREINQLTYLEDMIWILIKTNILLKKYATYETIINLNTGWIVNITELLLSF